MLRPEEKIESKELKFIESECKQQMDSQLNSAEI